MASLTDLDAQTLDDASLALLHDLTSLPWSVDFYLAGSAALTLYLGHRPVRDLDLMTSVRRLRSIERRDHLQSFLQLDDRIQVETARDGLLSLRAAHNVGLRLYYYPYPLVDPTRLLDGIAVASPLDLGLMKLGAIISRGARRDFVDLFLLCRQVPLSELLDRAHEKFGHVRDFPLQALKGLADRSQVRAEPMPRLSRQIGWEQVERWLDEQVRTLGRRHVGLA